MIEVTVAGVGDVVVDVDPEGGLGGRVQGVVAQAWLGRAQSRAMATWTSSGSAGWGLDLVAARQEGQVVRQCRPR